MFSGRDKGGERVGLDQVELPRPTWRTAGPFVAVGLLGLVALAFAKPDTGPLLWVTVGISALSVGVISISIRRDRRTWLSPVAPWTFFLVIALILHLTGGTAASGLAPLVLVPILWIALSGTRIELWITAAMTAAVFWVPIVLFGPPEYPASGWRRGLVYVAIALVIAPVIQRLVRELARERQELDTTSRELAGILRAARLTTIVATDTSGNITSFSEGAEALLGYRADEVKGSSVLMFFQPDELQTAADEVGVDAGTDTLARLARTRAQARDWSYRTKSGQSGYLRLAATEMLDDDGNLVGFLGMGIDITQAVNDRKALAAAEGRWRVLLDHLPKSVVLVVDEDDRVQVVGGSGELRQWFRQALGLSIVDVLPGAEAERVAELLTRAREGREGYVEITDPTGGVHEVVSTGLPGGDAGSSLLLARDVSTERSRERSLRQAKEREERLFLDAPYGVALLDADGTVLRANQALLDLAGRTRDEVVGHPLGELGSPDDARLAGHLAAVEGKPTALSLDWQLHRPRGRVVHVSLSSRSLTAGPATTLVHVVDASQQREYEKRLTHLADHDALTGLANRRRFEEQLHTHLEDCRKTSARGAVLLLDLDRFKDVNDTLGHAAGDQLISEVARVLTGTLRGTDVVARMGGDEFAVLLSDADAEAARAVAALIIERVRTHAASQRGAGRRVTVSIGGVTVASAFKRGGDLLALADLAMYDAKEAGRDGYLVVADAEMETTKSGQRLAWQERLQTALGADGFELHLQPILDLRSGRVDSAEVLVRLRHEDALVGPGEFIPVAERSGLITEIDQWVVSHAVELLANMRRAHPRLGFHVNLSGQGMSHPDVEAALVQALETHCVPGSALVLEVTETAAVADVAMAREFARRMRALGCQLALDDFGAGFGSYAYLRHLVCDIVKIDGEFISSLPHSEVDRSIVRSIVTIASDLGMTTVAEFVTDEAVLASVRAAGVDFAQGEVVGLAVEPSDFAGRFLS